MEKDKKYNLVLGLMIFFFLIIVGASVAWGLGYIGVNKNSINENYEANNSTIENGQANIENQVSNNTTANNQTKVEEQASNKQTTSKTVSNVSLINIDSSKCLNGETGSEYHCNFNEQLGAYVRYDNNKLCFRLSDGEITEFMDGISIKTDTDYEIKNININEVAEIFVGVYGNGIDYPVVFFLMKNGTVNWLNVQDACVNKDFNAEGIISGVTDVVRIVNGGTNGGFTVLAFKQDGTFYDLISKTVNK